MKSTLITARLRFDTAGGVAGTEVRAGENGYVLPLRRDPGGKVSLPGTTIAGNLRAHCAAVDPDLGALFGDTPEQLQDKHEKAAKNKDADQATPSAVQVLGTVLRKGGKVVPHTRNTTDRRRGAARTHHFHRVELLEQGTEFDVVLRWNNADSAMLRERFLAALAQWHPVLGRGVTRGAGGCSLTGWGTADYDLDRADGLLAWLQDTGLESYPDPSETPAEPVQPQYVVDADLSIVDAIHCGTEQREPVEGERNNQIEALRRGDDFVVPGSTLKGILRSRAEYICRVLDLAACEGQRCGRCRPCLLFGFTGDEAAQRGRIVVEDATIRAAKSEIRPHVAIDRFTGGARDQALYEHQVVTEGTFPLRVRWLTPGQQHSSGTKGSTNAYPEPEQDARLLNAVLDDMNDGYLGIGARTTAGYGSVRVETCRSTTFERTELAEVLRDPATTSTDKGNE